MSITGAGDLSLEIGYRHESNGWMNCYITFDGYRHWIDACDEYPPFHDLLNLALAIAAQRLPHACYWDEEGRGIMISAWPVADDSPAFRLKIWHDREEKFWVDAELDRLAVVEVILRALRDFVLYAHAPSPVPWGISLKDIIEFEHLYKRPISPRNDICSAEPVKFGIERFDHYRWPSLWMHLEIWTMALVKCQIEDTNSFWPDWFALLEKIALDQLPAQAEFLDLTTGKFMLDGIAKGFIPETERWTTEVIQWRAEPLEHPNHFRLKIIRTNSSYKDFPLLDEVLDRRQFVSAFCEAFERMLKSGYRARKDEDGEKFNLRSLPLAKLKKLVE